MITAAELLRITNVNWEDLLWGGLWAVLIIVVFTVMIISSTIVQARKRFIKNELPRLHNKTIKGLQEEVKRILAENKRLVREHNQMEKEHANHIVSIKAAKKLLEIEGE